MTARCSSFATTASGYELLLKWLLRHGQVERIGIEGTGSYGSGLAAYLRTQSVTCVEVNRPSRQARRRRGKSDPADAEAAARATLAGEATCVPKAQDGMVEAIRILRLQRRSAMQSRTQAANQMHAVVLTAPETLREDLRNLSVRALVERVSKRRKASVMDAASATRRVLRGLGRRWLQMSKEISELDAELGKLVKTAAPGLIALPGVGIEVAGALLVAAGDNPERLANEASFAPCVASAPWMPHPAGSIGID